MATTVIILFAWSLLLVGILKQTAFAEKKSARVIGTFATLGWIGLTIAVVFVYIRLGHNQWYSGAASKMMTACISGLEQGRQDAVLREMRRMATDLRVTYETRGNFAELAERTASCLATDHVEQGTAPDPQ